MGSGGKEKKSLKCHLLQNLIKRSKRERWTKWTIFIPSKFCCRCYFRGSEFPLHPLPSLSNIFVDLISLIKTTQKSALIFAPLTIKLILVQFGLLYSFEVQTTTNYWVDSTLIVITQKLFLISILVNSCDILQLWYCELNCEIINCRFDKIINKEIPSKIVYEDEKVCQCDKKRGINLQCLNLTFLRIMSGDKVEYLRERKMNFSIAKTVASLPLVNSCSNGPDLIDKFFRFRHCQWSSSKNKTWHMLLFW